MPAFVKQPVALGQNAVIVIFTVRNEEDRLPYFLSYYRELGVDHFFAVDNNSTDRTTEILKAQKDVSYFSTDQSYVSSKSGRLWTTELAQFYGSGRWCLTVDVDELFVFPGSEYGSIKDLCAYLDANDYQGVFTIFLDLYSDKRLSETIYRSGTPFLDTCRYFEIDNYVLQRSENFPYIQIFGGPRQRIFWSQGESGAGPSMRKVPLVKWHDGFDYIFSTHSSLPIRLADVSGAVLHFKFFASFKETAVAEHKRGDRTQKGHYKAYAEKVEQEDLLLFSEISVKYTDSFGLVELGLVATSKKFGNAVADRLRARQSPAEKDFRSRMLDALAVANKQKLRLSDVGPLWMLTYDKLSSPVVSGVATKTSARRPTWARRLMQAFARVR